MHPNPRHFHHKTKSWRARTARLLDSDLTLGMRNTLDLNCYNYHCLSFGSCLALLHTSRHFPTNIKFHCLPTAASMGLLLYDLSLLYHIILSMQSSFLVSSERETFHIPLQEWNELYYAGMIDRKFCQQFCSSVSEELGGRTTTIRNSWSTSYKTFCFTYSR